MRVHAEGIYCLIAFDEAGDDSTTRQRDHHPIEYNQMQSGETRAKR